MRSIPHITIQSMMMRCLVILLISSSLAPQSSIISAQDVDSIFIEQASVELKELFAEAQYDSFLVYSNNLITRLSSNEELHASTIAKYHNDQGVVHHRLHQYDLSLESFLEALYVLQKYDVRPASQINLLRNVGITYQNNGEWRTAASYYNKAIEYGHENIDRSLRVKSKLLSVLIQKCRHYETKGLLVEALHVAQRAELIADEHYENPGWEHFECYAQIGHIYDRLYADEKGAYYLVLALEISETQNLPSSVGLESVYDGLGHIYQRQGRYEDALRFQNLLLDYYNHIYGPKHCFLSVPYSSLSGIYEDIEELEQANYYMDEALRLADTDDPDIEIKSQIFREAGDFYARRGDFNESIDLLEKSLASLDIDGQDSDLAAFGTFTTLTLEGLSSVYLDKYEIVNDTTILNKAITYGIKSKIIFDYLLYD